MDVFDVQTRSRVMAKVRGRDAKPEMAVRRYLHARGLRFRLHRGDLPGRPDLVFPGHRIAVFVHGFFWPQKLEGNVERDTGALADLEAGGRTALVVWACKAGPAALEAIYERIVGTPARR